ncbi:hypothetical protein CLTEP_10400 [Clostridium tepidiprofundi DSM 19306]|uniref:Uncharacterized protein n=1 Tax=Clostridium tepidiprofundi DSM 19306 TaxID=1121338 RepID=A0A151B5W7_9CLOT|nr:hypothetical protein CLTEP_10400 [Clostridium tepidiprofundi DSM 19306]
MGSDYCLNKKNIYFIPILILIVLFFSSCTVNIDKFIEKNKPNKFYYTQSLVTDFHNNPNHSVNVLYLNFYKSQKLDKSEILILRKFFKNLKNSDFISKPENLPDKPVYKLFCMFDNKCKYVIEVYNDRFLCIYPWDGYYEEDYIDMKNTYNAYNIMGLCKYVFNKGIVDINN